MPRKVGVGNVSVRLVMRDDFARQTKYAMEDSCEVVFNQVPCNANRQPIFTHLVLEPDECGDAPQTKGGTSIIKRHQDELVLWEMLCLLLKSIRKPGSFGLSNSKGLAQFSFEENRKGRVLAFI